MHWTWWKQEWTWWKHDENSLKKIILWSYHFLFIIEFCHWSYHWVLQKLKENRKCIGRTHAWKMHWKKIIWPIYSAWNFFWLDNLFCSTYVQSTKFCSMQYKVLCTLHFAVQSMQNYISRMGIVKGSRSSSLFYSKYE